MLRNLVLALIALNLIYLGWVFGIGRDDPLTAAVPPPRRSAAATVTAPPCATFGPFSEPLLALQAGEFLRASGLAVQSRDASETIHDGWWVHVEGADQDQQSRIFAALRGAGIRDAFAIPDDPRFRVSVGVFSTEDRAQDRAAQVQRLRLDAVVSERLREQASTWLDVGIAREALQDGRLAAAGMPLDNLRVETCPTPAPPAAAGMDIIPAP